MAYNFKNTVSRCTSLNFLSVENPVRPDTPVAQHDHYKAMGFPLIHPFLETG